MKLNRSKLFKLAATGSAGLAMAHAVQAATILDYTSASGTLTTHGSNAVDTPNVSLLSTVGLEAYGAWDGRGDVAQTDYNVQGGSVITITFTPDAEYGVFITSFDLDEWVGGGDSSLEWSIVGGSVNLSGTWNAFNTANDPGDAGGRTHIATGMSAGNASANIGVPMILSLTLTGGAPNYLAIDNLAFDQVTETAATLTITPNGASYDFTWDSRIDKIYDLVSATDLTTAPVSWPVWNGYADIPSAGTSTSLIGVPGGDPTRFFAMVEKEPPPLLDENFDNTAALPLGWSSSGPSNGTDWEVGAPSGVSSGPPAASSLENCAGTNIGGYYTENAVVSLKSLSFLVPEGSGATLSFKQFIDTDLAGAPHDLGSVRILDADNGDAPIAGLEITEIEDDGLDGWTNESLDLPMSDVGGKNIKVEFRFVTNPGTLLDNEVWSGFYVDDVNVTEVAP